MFCTKRKYFAAFALLHTTWSTTAFSATQLRQKKKKKNTTVCVKDNIESINEFPFMIEQNTMGTISLSFEPFRDAVKDQA